MIPIANVRFHCTVYAAVSPNCLDQPVFLVQEQTTNNVGFRTFLRDVIQHIKPTSGKPYAVFDGHNAHLQKDSAKMLQGHFIPLRIPPRSCQFNSVERLFAYLKPTLCKLLAYTIPTSKDHFFELVMQACRLINAKHMKAIVISNRQHIVDCVNDAKRINKPI